MPRSPKYKGPKPTTVDFETFGIQKRPTYPPMPVGVSIKKWGRKPRYYAFGHREGNNCTWGEAHRALEEAYANPDGVLFHNASFDLDVAEVWFGLKLPPWQKIHETMFLLFLDDPFQQLALKPAAANLLDMRPEERDGVVDWLVEHQPVPGVKLTNAKGSKAKGYTGPYIALAPGDVVGKYADGDVRRTEALFKLLWPLIEERGMVPAYDRERRLLPIMLEMERKGMAVDLPKLRGDVTTYREAFATAEAWIRDRLRAPDLNLNAGAQVLGAMQACGVVDVKKLKKTDNGAPSTAKDSLPLGVTDPELLGMWNYRARLKTALTTFMEPWLEQAESTGGVIHTIWNQVLSEGGGTQTGRFSSRPNFQNLPKKFKPVWRHEALALAESKHDPDERAKALAKVPEYPERPIRLPSLPSVRGYVTAFKGETLGGIDFSGQELRILAHFENGDMLRAYVENPDLDLHQYAADVVSEQIPIARDDAKVVAFSILYGSGAATLAAQIGCSVDAAKEIKWAYLRTFPGILDLIDELKARAIGGKPYYTIGGREYYCEKKRWNKDEKRWNTYEYKMLNYLIQGSAADQMKEAVIRFAEHPRRTASILAIVHDEFLISIPLGQEAEQMALLDECMRHPILDTPITTDAETGPTWQTMTEYRFAA